MCGENSPFIYLVYVGPNVACCTTDKYLAQHDYSLLKESVFGVVDDLVSVEIWHKNRDITDNPEAKSDLAFIKL